MRILNRKTTHNLEVPLEVRIASMATYMRAAPHEGCHLCRTGCLVPSRTIFRNLKKRRKLPTQMQFRDDDALDPYWVCNACVELATRTDSASDEERPPAKKAQVHGSSTSGEPLGEKARPDREAAAPKAIIADPLPCRAMQQYTPLEGRARVTRRRRVRVWSHCRFRNRGTE
jgi:hypothetical protein